MGRRENPITTPNKALAQLAQWLRERREEAGSPPYRVLGELAGCAPTTLARAASGKTVPSLETVRRYAHVCNASEDKARLLWARARREELHAVGRGASRVEAPRTDLIRDLPDLSAALASLHEQAGAPPYRKMEKFGPHGVLSRSAAYRIAKRKAVPATEDQLIAFVRACGTPPEHLPLWVAAWERARSHDFARKTLDPKAERYIATLTQQVETLRSMMHDHGASPTLSDEGTEEIRQGSTLILSLLYVMLPPDAAAVPGMSIDRLREFLSGGRPLSDVQIERYVLLSLRGNPELMSPTRWVLYRAMRLLSRQAYARKSREIAHSSKLSGTPAVRR